MRNSAILFSFPGGLLVSIRMSSESRSAVGCWLDWPEAKQAEAVNRRTPAATLNFDLASVLSFMGDESGRRSRLFMRWERILSHPCSPALGSNIVSQSRRWRSSPSASKVGCLSSRLPLGDISGEQTSNALVPAPRAAIASSLWRAEDMQPIRAQGEWLRSRHTGAGPELRPHKSNQPER